MSIIDCHVHLNNYDEINKTENKVLSLQERLNTLLETMENNNIVYSILLSSYKIDANRPSTDQIIDIVNKNDKGNKIGVVAGFTIDNHTQEDLKNYRQWLKDDIIKGIKLYCGYEHHYPYDERYQIVYDMCIEYGCPLMIHTGDAFSNRAKIKYSHPLNIDDVAVDNPELKIVMCHIGNPWITDCQEILYKNKNVYADISGLIVGNFTLSGEIHYSNKIKEILNYVDNPHHLLYGSDWPISSMKSYTNLVQKLELDKDSFDLLMFRNAKSIFKISI
ncbi:MAG: amidohydrolase [Thermoproteota archaeon]|nr:amidohydrolase [Thermoproteota archaeon]